MIDVNEQPADQNANLGSDVAEDSDLGDQVPATQIAPATPATPGNSRSANIGHNSTEGTT